MSKVYVEFAKGAEDWCKQGFFDRFSGTGLEVEEAAGAPYFIATPHTWLDPAAVVDFLSRMRNRITVLDCCAEAISPDLNVFDYSIGFAKEQVGDRFVYFPVGMERYLDIVEKCAERTLEEKLAAHKYFCNFIYSNDAVCTQRAGLFDVLSSYKYVHAPGKCKHNTDMFAEMDDPDNWYEPSIKIKRLFKFGVAAENAWHPYYTSEKIATTFLAGSVPIYWGNPFICQDYNPEAFIDANKFGTAGELLKEVERLDNDDESYMKMLAAPCKTEEQIATYKEAYKCGKEMLCDIFTMPFVKAFRRGTGTNTVAYRYVMKMVYSGRPVKY